MGSLVSQTGLLCFIDNHHLYDLQSDGKMPFAYIDFTTPLLKIILPKVFFCLAGTK